MAKRQSPDPDPSNTGYTPLDSFLLDHIRLTPGIRFGAILQAAQTARNVPRTTAARHLSRLVKWGDVTLLPDRSYVVGEPNAPSRRAVLEVRWSNIVVIIRPDGAARIVSEEELRVVAGHLDHFEFNHPKTPKQFIVWTTAGGRVSQLPAADAPNRLAMHRVELPSPLTARTPTWHRVCVNVEWGGWYRMGRPSPASRIETSRSVPDSEFQSIQVESLGRRFERRLTPDAQLRLQVVFPDGYPVGRARHRVLFQSEPSRADTSEEERLAELARDQFRQDGLRRFGTTLTLTVPHPIVDRHYTVQWNLPPSSKYRRWLSDYRRRLAR